MTVKASGPLDMAGNQIIALRVESLASFPTAGSAGRLAFNSTSGKLGLDDGSEFAAFLTENSSIFTDAFIYRGELDSSDNLDTVLETGWYAISSASLPAGMPEDGGSPITMTAMLHVYPLPGSTAIQEIVRVGGVSTQGSKYVRALASGSWNIWERMDTRTIADVDGLQDALDGKAASSHTHSASEITDFTAEVNTQIAAYWATIADTDTEADTIREALDLILANAGAISTISRWKFETVGNGSDTSFVVTHNFGTKDVIVEVREISSDKLLLKAAETTTVNSITVKVSPAPSTDNVRVSIIAPPVGA